MAQPDALAERRDQSAAGRGSGKAFPKSEHGGCFRVRERRRWCELGVVQGGSGRGRSFQGGQLLLGALLFSPGESGIREELQAALSPRNRIMPAT